MSWLVVAVLMRVATATVPATGDTGVPGTTGVTGDTGVAPATGDTGVPEDPGIDLDSDSDGFTPRQGDCDDTNRQVHPGQLELCEDRLDNDCDGLYDDGCDDAVRLASLRGGGGCTGGAGIAGTQSAMWGALLLVPFLVFARRQRR